MKLYFADKTQNDDGFNEVHTSDCNYLPIFWDRKHLGFFDSEKEALAKAKKIFATAKGCPYCCKKLFQYQYFNSVMMQKNI